MDSLRLLSRKSSCAARAGLLVLCLCALRPDSALAEDSPRERLIGFGIGMTGGGSGSSSRHLQVTLLEFGLLDFHILVPVHRQVELQLWVPISWLAFQNLVGGGGFVDLALMARVHPVRDNGFFVAPGLEVAYLGSNFSGGNFSGFGSPSSAGSTVLEFPLSIGYEAASGDRSFGFTIALRPLLGAAFHDTASGTGTAFMYGALLELGFNFYALSASSTVDPFGLPNH